MTTESVTAPDGRPIDEHVADILDAAFVCEEAPRLPKEDR